jgi:outer membrane protein assembly factor BamE (lipoprotein component of BamABCDE complex)
MPVSDKLFKCAQIALVALLLPLANGCSTLAIPTPEEIIKKPLGTESVKIGMTKDQVASIWGKPSQVTTAENKEKWSSPREVWIYAAHYGSIPVDAGYLSKTQKLYFDGDNLTEISE